MNVFDVIIVGAGPAGISAAIQLKRQGIIPHIFERESLGGLLLNANLVENYPGFPGGISGTDLVALFAEQLQRESLEICLEEVRSVDYDGEVFRVETAHQTVSAYVIVLASGTKPLMPENVEIDNEAKNRVFYEVSPLMDIHDGKVAIVGGGDAAFDYALNLVCRSIQVSILNRSGRTRCLPLLESRAGKSDLIEYSSNSTVTEVKHSRGTGGVLIIRGRDVNGLFEMEADYLIFAIGREPELSFLSPGLQSRIRSLQEKGLLYLIGDVKNAKFRQTSIAVGDGVKAAMKISLKLRELTG